jgi:hypothetical protein
MALLLLATLAVCSNSQPLPTPMGGYLGCFDLSQLQVDSVKVRADVAQAYAMRAADAWQFNRHLLYAWIGAGATAVTAYLAAGSATDVA